MELSFSHNDSQIFNFFLFEGAFLRFDIEIVFSKSVEYFMDISSMSFDMLFFSLVWLSFCVDDPIVHEDREPS